MAIDHAIITAVRPSPDGRWLVVQATAGAWSLRDLWVTPTPADLTGGGAGLYAYALASRRLYRVSGDLTPIAFTGPAGLATIEATGPDVGQIVGQALDESATKVDRRPLVAVLPDATPAAHLSAAGVLFLTTAATFPAPPPTAARPAAIYRLNPDGRIDRLADADPTAGLTFAVSPDGRHVLFFQPTRRPRPDGNPPLDELAVMDADGSHRRAVLDLADVAGWSTVTPAWHGNDRITYVAAAPGRVVTTDNGPGAARATADRTVFELVDYDLPPTGPLRPATVLSRGWAANLKPSSPDVRPAPGPLIPAVQSPR